MQAQSIEYIFENEDVMQGGIVWNAVPDYMFTTGLSMSLQNNFNLQIYWYFLRLEKSTYPLLHGGIHLSAQTLPNICCCLLLHSQIYWVPSTIADLSLVLLVTEKLEVAVAANF